MIKFIKYAHNFRFQDLTIDQFRDIRSKAGGLVIMFFENISKLSFEERQVSQSIISSLY